MNNIEETNEDVSTSFPENPLVVTEDIRSYMYDTAKWTKFLAIVGFVFSALVAMAALGAGAFITLLNKMNPGNSFGALGTGFFTVYLLLMGLLYFYPSLLLFKHANAAKKAILYGDQENLSIAMRNMKSFFKFWGVLMIVILGLYAMIFLVGIAAGVGAGMAS